MVHVHHEMDIWCSFAAMTATVRHGRTDGKWTGQVYIGVHAVTGKHVRRKKTFTAPWTRPGRTDAQRQFDRWAAGLDRIELLGGGGTPLTVAEMMDRWVVTRRADWRAKALSSYLMKIRVYIRPHLGDRPIDSVTPADIDLLYAHLRERGGRISDAHPKGKPLSGTTVKSVHDVLAQAFRQAVSYGELRRSPLDGVRAPRKSTTEVVPPTAGQLSDLAAKCCTTPMRTGFFWLACFTGARRSQLLGVRWSDVDLDAGTVFFQAGVVDNDGEMVIDDTKTGQHYTVPIDEEMVADLRAVRKTQIETAVALGAKLVPDPYVFSIEPTGFEPWPPNKVSAWWRYWCAQAGVHFQMRNLRHWFATEALGNGTDIRTVAALLGHANSRMVNEVYGHSNPERAREASTKIGATLKGIRSA
jgi:integrase